MPVRYKINEEQVEEIKALRKKNQNKKVEKRIEALLLHAEGKKREEISDKTGLCKQYITQTVSAYCNNGIEAISGGKYGGNHRNMSVEEEKAFLSEFEKLGEKGQIIETSEIEKAYIEKVGHSIGSNQIYRVMKRHGWRKVMPRSKHPNKASDEVIESSKKLTVS